MVGRDKNQRGGSLTPKKNKKAQLLGEKLIKQRDDQLRKYLSLENITRKHTRQEIDSEIAALHKFLQETDLFEDKMMINRRLAKLESDLETKHKVAEICQLQEFYQKQRQDADKRGKEVSSLFVKNDPLPEYNQSENLSTTIAQRSVNQRIQIEQLIQQFKQINKEVGFDKPAQKCSTNSISGDQSTESSLCLHLCSTESVEQLPTETAQSSTSKNANCDSYCVACMTQMAENHTDAKTLSIFPLNSRDRHFALRIAADLNEEETMLDNALREQSELSSGKPPQSELNNDEFQKSYERVENFVVHTVDQQVDCKKNIGVNKTTKFVRSRSHTCMIS